MNPADVDILDHVLAVLHFLMAERAGVVLQHSARSTKPQSVRDAFAAEFAVHKQVQISPAPVAWPGLYPPHFGQ